MSTRTTVGALVLVGVAALAGACSSGGGTVEVATSATATPTTTTPATTTATTTAATTTTPSAGASGTATAAGSPRSEPLGAPATVSDAAGVAYTFSVDGVEPDPSCAGSATTAGAHLLLVSVTLRTTAAFTPGSLDLFNAAGALSVVAGDGTVTRAVRTLTADACATQVGAVPDPVRPDAAYSFGFVVESPVTTGTLVYAPAGTDGWEWSFPG